VTHVSGYTKKDGTVVPPHDDKRGKVMGFIAKHSHHLGLKPKEPKHYPNAMPHPMPNDYGDDVTINEPSTATPLEAWGDSSAIATLVPGGPVPDQLNGVPFSPWRNAPDSAEEWNEVEGQDHMLHEPPFESLGKPAAGVVVEEPDGRVWVIHPTNRFGGYAGTFPKGRLEEGINLQASAIKEAYEESGLQVEITGFLGDVERSVTTARYYTARRVGGTPSEMGWESQGVSLVPRSKLYEVLNSPNDHGLAEALGAGEPPEK
jgi:8-oxo-dGTP pyrophosphatase MutT (NUDIX family)